MNEKGQEFADQAGISYNENMSRHTTFKTGGNARVFASPKTAAALLTLIKFVRESSIRYFILGGGSNVVFCDQTFEGVVINTSRLNSISIEEKDKDQAIVKCECGAMTAAFVNWCSKEGLSGAEEFAGLPGSTGGAVYMNARCFDKEISNIFYSARYINQDNNIEEINYNSDDWSYKKSPFTDSSLIILEACFKLKPVSTSIEEIQAKCRHYVEERKAKGHFKYPCAGSVFKNNRAFGKPSGAIIDQCGLKGLTNGGAKVADFHGNIIVNTGNASSSQILQLVEKVQAEVKNKTGFLLEPEIIFIQP